MKIEKIYFKDLGPVSNTLSPINIRDTWAKKIYSSVLFSGPNGSGKTILLDSIAYLWEALGHWFNHKTPVPGNSHIYKWFDQWGGAAVIFDELPDFAGAKSNAKNGKSKVCLFVGEDKWLGSIREENESVDYWEGEVIDHTNGKNKKERVLYGQYSGTVTERPGPSMLRYGLKDNKYKTFFNKWEQAYKKLVLGVRETGTPNMIYLDGEERKWIKPGKNIGKLIPDDMTNSWMFKYTATEDWKDQLENSLVNFKIVASEKKFKEVIGILNTFLEDKEIVAAYRSGDRNRLRVRLKKNGGKYHFFDELSSGERQILILLYNVIRWMEECGIVMIDEPDLFLHPSLVTRILSVIEGITERRNGQLIITSHNKDVWERYENLGIRIKLS